MAKLLKRKNEKKSVNESKNLQDQISKMKNSITDLNVTVEQLNKTVSVLLLK